MYAVSNAYKEAMKKPVQRSKVEGKIGSVPFSDVNILSGSFSITNQCSGSDQVEIGTVYTGELDITLLPNTRLTRGTLQGAVIKPNYGQMLENGTYEWIPLGVFYVSEANWGASGVEIKAYDVMSKLDKACIVTQTAGRAYALAQLAAEACSVEFDQTSAEFRALPNGLRIISCFTDNDIETWRDWVSWLAKTLGCFATATRDGKIRFVQYGTNVVDTIDTSHRVATPTFSDFSTRYTGISLTQTSDQTLKYCGLVSDDGLSYNLGSNPFMQYGTDQTKKDMMYEILNAIAVIDYVPFSAQMIGNPAYDLGDVLQFPGGVGDDGLHCITKFTWKFHGGYSAEGVGKDPAIANAKSKTDKNLAGLLSNASNDAISYYDYVNAEAIHIGDGQKGQIIQFHYVTTKDTHIDFHAEVKYKLSTTETYDETEDTYTEADGVLKVSYNLNGEDVTDYYPVETRLDGTHLLHLIYTWRATANVIGDFKVYLEMEGGSVDIGAEDSRAYIAGTGLVGDDAWDGSLKIDDKIAPIDLRDIIVEPTIGDSVTTEFVHEDEATASDTIGAVDLMSYLMSTFTDAVGAAYRLHRFDVLYSTSLMAYSGTEASGGVWKNASGTSQGTLTTPNCTVNNIMQITSRHSGDDVAYVVSFDGGTTWWTYADKWSEPDYTQDVYGMVEGTMRSITKDQWAEKLTGTIMVRAILTEQAIVTDIQIYEEEIAE